LNADNRLTVLQALRESGFAFVPAEAVRDALRLPVDEQWPAFAASWDGMARDQYMGDGGRYRFRRYATLAADKAGQISVSAPQPHFQSTDYNRLNGGVARWFEAIPDVVLQSPVLTRIFATGTAMFSVLKPGVAWHIEAHQFRIQASSTEAGKPTPEGVHRDGVDFVVVMMVTRENIESGTTTIHAPDGTLLDKFTLTQPFDTALLDDHRCLHGVTPVTPLDPTKPAWRDVLVVTWRATR
jgi:hypothetical protein